MNHEDVVLRQIAELEELEEQLNARAELDVNTKNQPQCPVCLGEWHGLDNHYCPGAFASQEQKQAFWEARSAMRATHIWLGRSWQELHRMSQQVSAIGTSSPQEGTSHTWTHTLSGDCSGTIVVIYDPHGSPLWTGYSSGSLLEQLRNRSDPPGADGYEIHLLSGTPTVTYLE